MGEQCPGKCCPHDGAGPGCPDDLPQAELSERCVHLYACTMLSTYKIGVITGIGRQRVTRLLHKAGVAVKPRGTGRIIRHTTEDARLDQLMVCLYVEQRMSSTEIAAFTGLADRTVRQRLRLRGVRMRTRGRYNREDRTEISMDDLNALYSRAGLSADETGKQLGVSRMIVLRSAHDQGVPVRVGGPPPSQGPTEIELLVALYADPQVRDTLDRHSVPVVLSGGPLWEAFPYR